MKKEIWSFRPSDQRELQGKWSPVQVMEASSYLIDQKPDLEMKLKVDHIAIKGLLADYGRKLHIAKQGDRFVILIEGDSLHFEKGVSLVELLKPDYLHEVIERIINENN